MGAIGLRHQHHPVSRRVLDTVGGERSGGAVHLDRSQPQYLEHRRGAARIALLARYDVGEGWGGAPALDRPAPQGHEVANEPAALKGGKLDHGA